ncbi:hypothetical protein [Mastigocoleus testarum]|uniref:Uncharacterized protein n=1 Tax=Mastigocoleus testarum BC008 TaxID=371196 RepID=A0A0V7ZM50_9CYAN|nr:hypothetical protein [Mastigocoleus testarum]KST65528.1 hypothetical protein BC008_42140 [Mastigocoleus testarum BC008]KST66084.1 hypothetical protein BC008_24215 [Mastigocoleus testarum BC008]
MSRRITTTQYQSALPAKQIDTYFDKVIKYIPADIVGAWVAVNGLIKGADITEVSKNIVLWTAFVIGIVITALWTHKQTQEPKKVTAITQIVISTGAFIVWVYASGGPFTTAHLYNPTYGSILLIFYSLIVALINPTEG